jgi:hypothetical protein
MEGEMEAEMESEILAVVESARKSNKDMVSNSYKPSHFDYDVNHFRNCAKPAVGHKKATKRCGCRCRQDINSATGTFRDLAKIIFSGMSTEQIPTTEAVSKTGDADLGVFRRALSSSEADLSCGAQLMAMTTGFSVPMGSVCYNEPILLGELKYPISILLEAFYLSPCGKLKAKLGAPTFLMAYSGDHEQIMWSLYGNYCSNPNEVMKGLRDGTWTPELNQTLTLRWSCASKGCIAEKNSSLVGICPIPGTAAAAAVSSLTGDKFPFDPSQFYAVFEQTTPKAFSGRHLHEHGYVTHKSKMPFMAYDKDMVLRSVGKKKMFVRDTEAGKFNCDFNLLPLEKRPPPNMTGTLESSAGAALTTANFQAGISRGSGRPTLDARTVNYNLALTSKGTSVSASTCTMNVNQARHMRERVLIGDVFTSPYLASGEVVTRSTKDTFRSVQACIDFLGKEFESRSASVDPTISPNEPSNDPNVTKFHESLGMVPGSWAQAVIPGPMLFRDYTIILCFNMQTVLVMVMFCAGNERNRDIAWHVDTTGIQGVVSANEVGDDKAEAWAGRTHGHLASIAISIDQPRRGGGAQLTETGAMSDMEILIYNPEKAGFPVEILEAAFAELMSMLQIIVNKLVIDDLFERSIRCHNLVIDHGALEIKFWTKFCPSANILFERWHSIMILSKCFDRMIKASSMTREDKGICMAMTALFLESTSEQLALTRANGVKSYVEECITKAIPGTDEQATMKRDRARKIFIDTAWYSVLSKPAAHCSFGRDQLFLKGNSEGPTIEGIHSRLKNYYGVGKEKLYIHEVIRQLGHYHQVDQFAISEALMKRGVQQKKTLKPASVHSERTAFSSKGSRDKSRSMRLQTNVFRAAQRQLNDDSDPNRVAEKNSAAEDLGTKLEDGTQVLITNKSLMGRLLRSLEVAKTSMGLCSASFMGLTAALSSDNARICMPACASLCTTMDDLLKVPAMISLCKALEMVLFMERVGNYGMEKVQIFIRLEHDHILTEVAAGSSMPSPNSPVYPVDGKIFLYLHNALFRNDKDNPVILALPFSVHERNDSRDNSIPVVRFSIVAFYVLKNTSTIMGITTPDEEHFYLSRNLEDRTKQILQSSLSDVLRINAPSSDRLSGCSYPLQSPFEEKRLYLASLKGTGCVSFEDVRITNAHTLLAIHSNVPQVSVSTNKVHSTGEELITSVGGDLSVTTGSNKEIGTEDVSESTREDRKAAELDGSSSVQWVQCDTCSKWRKWFGPIDNIPKGDAAFNCHDNVYDLIHNTCSVAEEKT